MIIYSDWGRSSTEAETESNFWLEIIIVNGGSEKYVYAEVFLKAFIKKLLGSVLNDQSLFFKT